jgi:hypothetical protein
VKLVKKMSSGFRKALAVGAGFALSSSVWAEDKLAQVIGGEVQDMFGSGASFWKLFILVDIILAVAVVVKTKNPMAFLGVLAVAIVPTFLIRTFVF